MISAAHVPCVRLVHMVHRIMEIVIDIDSKEPLFAQLIGQIKHAVMSGKLKPADPLPSIRQLAADLDLNNKTVAKAYSLLERDEVIESKGYRGTFVHPNAKANSKVDLKELALQSLEETVTNLRSAGITDSEIRIAFSDVMNHQKR